MIVVFILFGLALSIALPWAMWQYLNAVLRRNKKNREEQWENQLKEWGLK